jgi:cytochrome c oxidase subunit II
MDKYEKKVIMMSGALLVVFLLSILRTMSTGAADVPTCLPYDPSYLEPRIEVLDDSTYQVFCVAQMWSFEPTEIFIPVGAEVDFYLTTKDVVHGFHIAEKNVNMMAVYGGINKTTVRFDEPGVFEIICHEYCGSGHQNMRAEVIVNYPN